MTNWQESDAAYRWAELKASAEHYEMLQANAEASTHSEAEFWATEWRVRAQEKRRQMQVILDAMPTREEMMEAA